MHPWRPCCCMCARRVHIVQANVPRVNNMQLPQRSPHTYAPWGPLPASLNDPSKVQGHDCCMEKLDGSSELHLNRVFHGTCGCS